MPRTTVYIRDADWDKWKLIDNKAELISQAINRSIIQPIKKKNGQIKTVQEVVSPEPNLVYGLGLPEETVPLQEMLGQPCSKKSKPCRHWHYDDTNAVWKNELTGEEREVV